ncbi:MAG: Bax inhibitor-1/YccA family protein [Pacificimonas sp.]|jgi:FtsH-binding integral membrane protein|nr:Bax inhibitor-1/YccA family protein [Pacificimonas sp.]
MVNRTDPRFAPRAETSTGAVPKAGMRFDAGLRKHMLSVYNYMASGVLLTGIVALLFSQTQLARDILMGGGLGMWVLMLAPLGFVLALSFGINRMSAAAAQATFWAFAVVMGLSMASIFWVFTGASIAQVFFATAAAFAGLSLYGYTTKRDLSGMGTFLIMGLIGLIVASVINIFLQSGVMQFVISIIGVLIFAGLTAYDTQKIKTMYLQMARMGAAAGDGLKKTAIMGALALYLDFINMFMFLLQLFGNRE